VRSNSPTPFLKQNIEVSCRIEYEKRKYVAGNSPWGIVRGRARSQVAGKRTSDALGSIDETLLKLLRAIEQT
jgi:hypothetical protein